MHQAGQGLVDRRQGRNQTKILDTSTRLAQEERNKLFFHNERLADGERAGGIRGLLPQGVDDTEQIPDQRVEKRGVVHMETTLDDEFSTETDRPVVHDE